MIDTAKPLMLKQIGLELPKAPPTQVVSILPYQALITLLLAESLQRRRAAH